MSKLIEFKTSNEYVDVEYEIITPAPLDQSSEIGVDIYNSLSSVETCLAANTAIIDRLNAKIDNLTNHADGVDNMVAVGSGILTGLIDSFFVGEFSLADGKKWSTDTVNKFVIHYAEKNGYKYKNAKDPLKGAIGYLERNFKLNSDKASSAFGSGKGHHLQDFTHHPTIFGLLFSIIAQFSGSVFGTDMNGKIKIVKVLKQNSIDQETGKAKFQNKGNNVIQKWYGHIISDIAGSSNSGEGMGLPGPIGATLKELSAMLNRIRPIDNTGRNKFSEYISAKFTEGLDFRTELGLYQQLGKQAIPIITNEIIVRGFYAIRRLTMEIKTNEVKSFDDLKRINWKNTIPNGNRTITRMLTIATGTFMAVDMADAAIRSGLKSGGEPSLFLTNFILHVNFVGVGRFAIAAGADMHMGHKQNKLRNERIAIYSEQLHLYSSKVYYKEAQMWIEAKNADNAIEIMLSNAEESIAYFNESIDEIKENTKLISSYMDDVEKKNPTLLNDMSNILKL